MYYFNLYLIYYLNVDIVILELQGPFFPDEIKSFKMYDSFVA